MSYVTGTDISKLLDRIVQLEAENAKLRKEKKRVDWLLRNQNELITNREDLDELMKEAKCD